MQDWRDLSYLLEGPEAQRRAYAALDEASVIAALDGFDPVLVGTVPLGVDVAGSDLDVLCRAPDLARFAELLEDAFGAFEGYGLERKAIRGVPTVIASFRCRDVPIEIFGQATPVEAQWGYRHLLVEARLLALGGDALREEVRARKRAGAKTEPAFAAALGLPDEDPYRALYALSWRPDEDLEALLRGAPV